MGTSFDWIEVWGLTSGDCILMFIVYFFHVHNFLLFCYSLGYFMSLFFCMNYSFNKILINYQIYILERLPNGLWLGAFSELVTYGCLQLCMFSMIAKSRLQSSFTNITNS